MTADGTYPFPRAGAAVSTAAELDALPDGSVVRDRDDDAWQRTVQGWVSAMSSESPMDADRLTGWHAPLTVLFRPDAPQPATGDDVERAARAVAEEMTHDTDYDPAYDYTEDSRRYARAALAARAGEAEPSRVNEERITNLLADLSSEPAHRHAALVREFVADARIEVTR